MDLRERYNDPEDALRALLSGDRSDLWTALPGVVEGFDAAAMTVSVRPAIQMSVQQQDGSTLAVERALLTDVPVVFPGGGGFTLTFPIQKGDECLLVFSSRNIDAWWQSGGVQPAADARMHDLSDAFAFVGVRSHTRRVPVSTAGAQLRSDDGGTAVTLGAGSLTLSAGGSTLVLSAAGLIHNGTNIGATHKHSGVQTGSGITGLPQ